MSSGVVIKKTELKENVTPEHAVVFTDVSSTYSVEDYIKAVSSVVGSRHIHSAYRNGSCIKVYLRDKKYVSAVMNAGLIIKRFTDVHFAIPPATKIIISKVDPLIPDSYLLDLLLAYGSFKSGIIYEKIFSDPEYAHIRSDIRYVYMKINENVTIPSKLTLQYQNYSSEIDLSVESCGTALHEKECRTALHGKSNLESNNMLSPQNSETNGNACTVTENTLCLDTVRGQKSFGTKQTLLKNVVINSKTNIQSRKRTGKKILYRSKRLCKGEDSNIQIDRLVAVNKRAEGRVLSAFQKGFGKFPQLFLKHSLGVKQMKASKKKTFLVRKKSHQTSSSEEGSLLQDEHNVNSVESVDQKQNKISGNLPASSHNQAVISRQLPLSSSAYSNESPINLCARSESCQSFAVNKEGDVNDQENERCLMPDISSENNVMSKSSNKHLKTNEITSSELEPQNISEDMPCLKLEIPNSEISKSSQCSNSGHSDKSEIPVVDLSLDSSDGEVSESSHCSNSDHSGRVKGKVPIVDLSKDRVRSHLPYVHKLPSSTYQKESSLYNIETIIVSSVEITE